MSPFRLTVPHPLFLLISARYVYETLVFQKKCRPAMKKKILNIQETQIINGWYTFSPQRPTNGLNTFFGGFFFQRGHKKYSKRNGSKFPKTSISVPGHSPKRHTPTRRSITRSPSSDSWHWEATAITSANARREVRCPPGPPCMVNKGNPKGLSDEPSPTGPCAAALEAIPPDNWRRTWVTCRTIMLRRTSKRVKEQVDKMLLPDVVRLVYKAVVPSRRILWSSVGETTITRPFPRITLLE